VRVIGNYTPKADHSTGERIDVSYLPNTRLLIQRWNRQITKALSLKGIDRKPLPYLSLSMSGFLQSTAYNPNPFRGLPPENIVWGGASGNLGFGFLRGSVMANCGAIFYRETEANTENFHPMDYQYGVRLSQRIAKLPISAGAGATVRGGVHRPYFSVNTNYAFGVGKGYQKNIRRHRLSASADFGANFAYTPVYLREIYYPDSVVADPDFDGPLYELDIDNLPRVNIGGGAALDWRWSNGTTGNGAQSYAASTRVPDILDPQFTGIRASARQTHNRFQLTGNYSMINQTTNPVLTGQTHFLSGTMAGSLMFADGLWALGRPVYDGFILADAKHNFKGANVHVNRSHFLRRDYSRSGWFGAAYHNGVMSHSPSPVTLTITDAPPGAMLENNRFYALGGYKRGYALRIGSREGVLMQVRLTDGGRPLSYTYATVEQDGGRGEPEKRATFTGGDGVLQMGNLAPGRFYIISFGSGSSIRDIEIEIPHNADAILELPDIAVERE